MLICDRKYKIVFDSFLSVNPSMGLTLHIYL